MIYNYLTLISFKVFDSKLITRDGLFSVIQLDPCSSESGVLTENQKPLQCKADDLVQVFVFDGIFASWHPARKVDFCQVTKKCVCVSIYINYICDFLDLLFFGCFRNNSFFFGTALFETNGTFHNYPKFQGFTVVSSFFHSSKVQRLPSCWGCPVISVIRTSSNNCDKNFKSFYVSLFGVGPLKWQNK